MEITLRPAASDDCELIASWLNNPKINRFLSANLRSGGLNAAVLKLGLRRKDQIWTVFSNAAASSPLGLIALDSIDAGDGVGNLWFVLGQTSEGRKGFTSSAIRRFCEENPGGLAVASAWIVEGNTASEKCLLKAGFKRIGRMPAAVKLEDKRADRVLFSRRFGTTP